MKYWNSRLKNAREYTPGEQPVNINEYIKLNTNENPFSPSSAVINAIKNSCNDSLKRYPDPTAFELRRIYAEKNDLNPENIFIGNGSDEVFTLIFRGFIEQNATAAFPYPSYSLYETLAQINGINYKKINLNNKLNLELKDFLKEKYSLVIISNPNNPTGTYSDISKIKSFLKKFKGLLVVDEAYIDFYGGSAVSLINEHDNIIIVRSFSKSYSLAGLRIGLAVSNRDIINGFMKIKDSYNVDSLAVAGGIAALQDEKGFRYNLNMLINNKEYLETALDSLGFIITPSRANFLFVKHPTVSSEEIYKKLKEKKILIRYFTGPVQSEYIRITVGTMLELKALISGLESIFEA